MAGMLRMIREDVQKYGPGSRSNVELLCAVVGDARFTLDVASAMLAKAGGLRQIRRWSLGEMQVFQGIGEAAAVRLKAALEMGARAAYQVADDRPQIRGPADTFNLVAPRMEHLEQEVMMLVMLDAKNRVIGMETLYKGTANSVLCRVAELLRPAVRANAVTVILVHNHPSGDPSPSGTDVGLTEQVVQAGKLLDIEVLDHIIIGRQRFVSLKERGLGFR